MSRFEYYGFSVTDVTIQEYLDDLKHSNTWWGGTSYVNDILQGMIRALADGDYQFDSNDLDLSGLLEQVIIRAGIDENGNYTDEAHAAMRNLRTKQGKDPNAYVLYNKNLQGLLDKTKAKIGGMFSKRTKQPAKVASVSENKSDNKDATPANNAPVAAPKQQTAPKKQPAPKVQAKPNKAKRKFSAIWSRLTTTTAAVMAIGAAIFMTSDGDKNISQDKDPAKVPTFKTISVDAPTTYRTTRVYNLSDMIARPDANTAYSVKIPGSSFIQAQKKQAPVHVVATDSVSVSLTNASKSALDILLGENRAQELCDQVQRQIDKGIFVAPNGMSAERIAHAMTMSRIYEGKSVILDALKSDTALTADEQIAFDQHIASIGDMGVKLQQRMASSQQLSTHSKYDNASKKLQKMHRQNMKKLKQMKKAHTR